MAISKNFSSILNEEWKRAKDKVKKEKDQDYKISMEECKGLYVLNGWNLAYLRSSLMIIRLRKNA